MTYDNLTTEEKRKLREEAKDWAKDWAHKMIYGTDRPKEPSPLEMYAVPTGDLVCYIYFAITLKAIEASKLYADPQNQIIFDEIKKEVESQLKGLTVEQLIAKMGYPRL